VILIDQGQQLVNEFFSGMPLRRNDPFASSQSWHLDQRGWRSVLIEPHPKLTNELALVR